VSAWLEVLHAAPASVDGATVSAVVPVGLLGDPAALRFVAYTSAYPSPPASGLPPTEFGDLAPDQGWFALTEQAPVTGSPASPPGPGATDTGG
jgi:hypothetical protein